MLIDAARKLAWPVLKRIDARINTRAADVRDSLRGEFERRTAEDNERLLREFETSLRLQIEDVKEHFERRLKSEIGSLSSDLKAATQHLGEPNQVLDQHILAAINRRFSLPPSPPLWDAQTPFMAYSTCSAADFLHPRFSEISALMSHPVRYHRKLWEWVFIIHHLREAGVLQEGKRGVVFGVGRERLPSLFAKLGAEIVATDAPDDIGEESGWKKTDQHSTALSQIRYIDTVDGDVFDRKVSMRTCDMNNITPDLNDFDFTWSSCCLEHLGSLEAGALFVINSVEKTLKIGGTAVHTTEFNMSSNDETVTEGATVIYRKRDMEDLVRRLEDRGHHVQPFKVAPDSHFLDWYVDAPPFAHDPHLKLQLGKFVATSVGLVITRGR
jgi:hypothetical protein